MEFQKFLVIGGARSGKSRFAQKLADESGRAKTIIVTAEARDADMQQRILAHQADRDANWETVEAPLELAQAILQSQAQNVVMVDCLTLWLTNVMLADRDMEVAITELVSAVQMAQCSLVLVSNEVGLGIVPETAMGRDFRDWQGWLNQRIAQVCDGTAVMVSGFPLLLKPSALPDIRLK
ncbi:bifunctional adenosylcobinamide kinase/adenosylcobinamide-phosphate guanylyltransferase [Microvirga sp. W0021]|uniref:Bifunctional adenosylcobalamin biosynthesis protein n=1 Tax=Hohaiivirga grylli TaxID=3133970 RepID=A0ABV0BHY1_9HYPH